MSGVPVTPEVRISHNADRIPQPADRIADRPDRIAHSLYPAIPVHDPETGEEYDQAPWYRTCARRNAVAAELHERAADTLREMTRREALAAADLDAFLEQCRVEEYADAAAEGRVVDDEFDDEEYYLSEYLAEQEEAMA